LAVNAFLVRRQQDERESGSRELMMPRGNTRLGEDRMPQNPACNGWLQAGFLLCLRARREGVPRQTQPQRSPATFSKEQGANTPAAWCFYRRKAALPLVFAGQRVMFVAGLS